MKKTILLKHRMLHPLFASWLIALLLPATAVVAQQQLMEKPVVSVLLPLHLDSMYHADKYKFGNSIPRFALPYLEFYNGVLMAADSLSKEGTLVHIEVVDTRQFSSLSTSLYSPTVKQSKLLLAVAQNSNELKQMAAFAKNMHIPLISATFPNDGGVKNTPEMYVMNSTLKTHCEGIYKYLQQNHSNDNLVFVTRKGNVESYLKTWITEASHAPDGRTIHWKATTLSDSFQVTQLRSLLDSTKQNTIIAGTMDGTFGQRLVKQLSSLQAKYKSRVVGMPNWDDIDFRKPEYKGVEIVFSSPFISSSGNNDVFKSLSKTYAKKQNSKPSDMAVKGFEMTYRFTKTILSYPLHEDFADHANDRTYKIFNDFDFAPVTDSADNTQIHYFENRKLYFIRKMNGVVKGIY